MERLYFILLLALLIDRIFGDPRIIWQNIPHPIVLYGAAITFFDKRLNRKSVKPSLRKVYGCFAILILMTIVFFVGVFVSILLRQMGVLGTIVEAVLASIFLAQKSLVDHVSDVARAFQQRSLEKARHAVSMIVGRETDSLDENGVCRAAIESIAENSSDGVVAPAFWFLILGFPGLFCYKMLNTADSMIGYKNPRYKDFGWGAARLDDIANYLPARLTCGIIIVALYFFDTYAAAKRAFGVIMQDARFHRSPNAGFPECAFAGGLDIQLSGPRIYDGVRGEEPFQNVDGKQACPKDISRAIRLFQQSMTVLFFVILILFIITMVF